MVFTEERGNLFELDNKYALAHCISLDAAMGAGIAKEFVKRYPDLKPYVIKTIRDNHLDYPTIVPYSEENVIFNLITKEKYWHKPTYKTLKKCLDDLVFLCEEYNIEYLGIPKLGCGLDRLSWSKVRDMIQDKFKDMDIEIRVRYI